MNPVSIQEKLKSIKRWQFVPGKNKILPVLESLIKKDEFIVDVIDGFFPAGEQDTGSDDDSGLILVTDRTVVLIRSKYPDRYRSLGKESIRSIVCIKNFSSLTIRIVSEGGEYAFVTGLSDFAVKNIFSAAGKPVDKEIVSGREQKIITREPSGAAAETMNCPGSSVKHLLYPEVKKISQKLDEFKKIISDEDFISMFRDDIYTISGICGTAGRDISDNKMLFICMVLSAGEDNPGDGRVCFIDEVMRCDSFPVSLEVAINRRMDAVTEGIDRANSIGDKRLKSVEYLAGYDIAHGTGYADKMAVLLYEYSQFLLKADGVIDPGGEAKLKQISELIQSAKSLKMDPDRKPAAEEETIDQVMEKINSLVGMENIKDEIKSFINFVSIRNERDKRKLPVTPVSLHAVFYGPPGTGKTTIARLLGRVYKALGLLKSGHLVETDRAGLVAGYVGQTAIKTDELVTKAKDGILFIDEAYTLAPENGGSDYGRESIDTILKRMEDQREGFAVIAAGYTDEMERFINSNPGLKSRFSRFFYFDHYTPDELLKIFKIFADNVEFKLNPDAENRVKDLITHFYNLRGKSFGNARFVRNVFDKTVQNQADRLAPVTTLTNEILCEITADDIPDKEDFTAEQFS